LTPFENLNVEKQYGFWLRQATSIDASFLTQDGACVMRELIYDSKL
jgi:hypothetical protein